jgi:hypothetical protein
MGTTVNWTSTGAFGITPRGYTITSAERNGVELWRVFDERDRLLGYYTTRDEAVAAAR